MSTLAGILIAFWLWLAARFGAAAFYTIEPNERGVVTTFGRAQRIGIRTTGDDGVLSQALRPDERERYSYPRVCVQGPGLHWKLPWQAVHKVSIATTTVSIAFDPETPVFQQENGVRDAVTKDQLNIGLTGQLRFAVSERNLYAYLFAIKNPLAHIMGYFISILRDRIANFEAPGGSMAADTIAARVELDAQRISINDLRKHLRDLNERMDAECAGAEARYGIAFDAALITGIDPPHEVEGALAASRRLPLTSRS
jgi:regulator of protease activity HflC (stomatin/prohibitin superfamily)